MPEAELDDLIERLNRTRWPRRWPAREPWTAGTDFDELQRLTEQWGSHYDGRSHEREINRLPSYPGFTFSDPAASSPPTIPTHELWHRLMTRLGFESYFAHGGDLGNGITSRLAAAHPDAVRAIHVMSVAAPRSFDEDSLTPAEREHIAAVEAWQRAEGAYMHQHQTCPLTLAFGLSDSPTGLLSWILEKYHVWSDLRAGTPSSLADDFVLTQASLYWFTNTIGTSLRPYYEALPPYGFVRVPTALALVPGRPAEAAARMGGADPRHPPVHGVRVGRALRAGRDGADAGGRHPRVLRRATVTPIMHIMST